MARGLALLLAALVAVPAGDALARTDKEKAQQELRQLERDIKRINREIAAAGSQRDTLQAQLREAEVAFGRVEKAAAENRTAIAAGKAELEQLNARRDNLQHSLAQQQARIALELKTAWKVGREGQLKLLLSQESPHTVARSMGYYRHFFRARQDLLGQYRDTLQELAALEGKIDATLAGLEQREEELAQQQSELAAARKERQGAVAKLTATIGSQSEQLKRKEADRRELEKLLRAIEDTVVKLAAPANTGPFTAARGKMAWPLPGQPSNRFGRPRHEGKMRWQGVFIPAGEGTPVRAIHGGRVVYADWLRGSGLLLILDHGEGYMSLYAHNQSLLKELGEWVDAGTPVSTVGDSGGEDTAALYFEVRHKGKPVDPAIWCR